ncbi:MAG: PEP-CTERM sorting domain-containing protein [Planctomycetales bacterium]|nr:PEP-CTERM sorting domain-containing protein [Planctomycetales bacterium]
MSRIVAFMVCLALCTTANADLVDISEIAWTAGDTSVSTNSSGGVSVDFNFSGTLPLAVQPATSSDPGVATPYIQTGVNTFDGGLVWRFAEAHINGDGPGVTANDVVTLAIDFGQPVNDLTFDLGDIDTGSDSAITGINFENWQDIVIVKGFAPGGAGVPGTATALAGGAASVIREDGNIYDAVGDPAITLAGIDGPAADDGNRGNVRIAFASAISKVLIDYRPGLPSGTGMSDFILGIGPAETTSQFISLHDLNFTAVPEPSSFLLIGLVGLGVGLRRRQQIVEFIRSMWIAK